MNLRSINVEKSIRWEKIKLTPLYNISEPYRMFKCINSANNLPVFKTGEVIVHRTSSTTETNENYWNMMVEMNNTKDITGVNKIEDCMIGIIEKYSELLFGIVLNHSESTNVFIRTDNTRTLQLFCEKDNIFYSTPNFSVYEPNKSIIASDRLVEDVVCVCAISPWILQVHSKTRRINIIWSIHQCMILQEPVNTDCILDADYEDDDENEKLEG